MKKNIIYIALVVFFTSIFVILFYGLERVETYIPEKITNKNVLKFSAKDLFSNKNVSFDSLVSGNKLTIINIWASWCKPCREEHKYLMKLKNQKNINLIGINYKDNTKNSKNFINKFGNPFSKILVDTNGMISINIGAYAVPETYIINSNKKILKKYIGPLTENNIEEIIRIVNEIN